MKHPVKIFSLLAVIVSAIITTSCSDTKSYAELLSDETKYINAYLADQKVIGSAPADSIFIQGSDAPFYRMNDDGTVYLRVINDNTDGVKAKYNDLVYMRFTRYNLEDYEDGVLPDGEGNDDAATTTFSFRYNNYTIDSSSEWGEGLQLPLAYLHYGCEVEMVIRSQISLTDEIASVVPYLYHVRYYKSNI
jgi:hypothetical protein